MKHEKDQKKWQWFVVSLPRAPAAAAGALTAAFIAEENIETNDFGASAPGPATSPDASWKYPLPPGTVACAVK